MPKQTNNPQMRNILADAWRLTWAHKWWWILGFIALMVTSSLGYQIIAQGITSITEPLVWFNRWQLWAQGISPIDFFQAQWTILLKNPESWFRAVFVWTIMLGIFLAGLSLSVYALVTLISAAKLKEINGMDTMILALREAKPSFKGVFGAIVLSLITVNVYVLAFSLPVILFGIDQNIAMTVLLYILFMGFVIGAFIISSMIMYVIQFIVVEQEKLANAIILSWALLKRYWIITLEMFIIQLAIGILTVSFIFLIVSLITIPVSIVGAILVAQQVYDLTIFLPQLTLFVLFLILITGLSAYSVFNLYSWTFLFMRFKEIHPKSRIAAWIELKMLSQEL
jgi:hypothetical protein